ncbi:AAA family ATPase [Candidatus Babeliales bacterium]|nr:AAA family ATPase [Candidatus Babeliales bacterium]
MKRIIKYLFLSFLLVGSSNSMQFDLPGLQWLLGDEARINLTQQEVLESGRVAAEFAGNVMTGFGNSASEWYKGDKEDIEKKIRHLSAERERCKRNIANKIGYSSSVNKWPDENYHSWEEKLAGTNVELEQLNKRYTGIEEKEKSWTKVFGEQTNNGMNLFWAKMNKDMRHEDIKVKARAEGAMAIGKWVESIKQLTKQKTLGSISLAVCGGAVAITGGYYGCKLSFNWLNAKIGKPTLVRESTRHDWKYALKNFWKHSILGYECEEISLEEVILEQKMATKLKFLADDTRNTMENSLPFRHTLFYGSPGTGKTMFAKRLARYSGMDYAIMSGADFAQFKNGEGIVELHKLFDWAEQSKRGLLIFIDEADAFLRDRRVLSNQGKNLVNAFLSRTGTSSEKYMLVFATNYEDELDLAALSRIHKKIQFPLPKLPERIRIFNLYFGKYIINDIRIIERNGSKHGVSIDIDKGIDQEFIKIIGQKIKGFSGREIEQMVSELRISAYNIGGGTLTKNIVNEVLEEKIKEHEHDTTCGKFQRERYESALGNT